MASRQQVAVLGLGKFGLTVARELSRLGHDVLAVDRDEKAVQLISEDVTHAIVGDITDPTMLKELGLQRFDTVIVSVSSNLEASIMSTMLLQQLGVREVIAKAADELHGAILERLGARQVVYPEREAGLRVARNVAVLGMEDYLPAVPGYGYARVRLRETFIGRSLRDLDLARMYGVTVVGLWRGSTVQVLPPSSEVLQRGDELIVAGPDEGIERVPGTAARSERYEAARPST